MLFRSETVGLMVLGNGFSGEVSSSYGARAWRVLRIVHCYVMEVKGLVKPIYGKEYSPEAMGNADKRFNQFISDRYPARANL